MIKPLIRPRRITTSRIGATSSPISRGLIVAAGNSVNKVQESTQTISKRLTKDQKFAMNYLEFFGSKKTTKILRKNLKSIKNSLMATFEMAKVLKKKVAETSKGGGGMGGILGGAVGLFGKGLFGKLLLAGLLGVSVGGIGYLLAKNPEKFFEFLRKQEEQFSRIVMGIVKKALPQLFLPSGLKELTTEFDTNLESQALALMEKDESLSKDDAIQKATLEILNDVSKKIISLRAERENLNFFEDYTERRKLADQIIKLEAFKKYMMRGDMYYADPLGGFTANNITGSGIDVPLRFESMIPEKRLSTVKNFVDTSGMSLDMLEFQVLQSANQPSNRGETRFYKDVLNYIDAKRKKEEKDFGVDNILPELFNKSDVIKGIRDDYKTRFPDIINYDPSKRPEVNVNVGSDVSQNSSGNITPTTETTARAADSGIIDINFLSPLNSDFAMERGTTKSVLNVYMG